jgi:hypothetical protein
LAAYRAATPTIIEETVARAVTRRHEVAHHGDRAAALIRTGMEFTTRMMGTAMAMGETSLLEDQLTWARDRLPHDGVEREHILSRFQIFRDVVQETLEPEHAAEVVPFIEWMMARQADIVAGNEE